MDTDRGQVRCDQLVIAAGPWIRDLWAMLDLPAQIPVTRPGRPATEPEKIQGSKPMWTYWALQEGTLAVDPSEFTDNRGGFPPVLHVDSSAPLYDDVTGDLITDRMWGIYYKPDFNFGGVQGGQQSLHGDAGVGDELAMVRAARCTGSTRLGSAIS